MMEDEGTFEFIFEENVHFELFYKLSRYTIDLLLIVNEYEIDFQSIISRITKSYPSLPIIVVCCDDNVQKAKELELLGAKVFIRKFTTIDFIEILKNFAESKRINVCKENHKEISMSLMQNRLNIFDLKKNQRKILSMLSSGEERKTIAEHCHLSLHTVHKYIQQIKENHKFSSVQQMISAFKQEQFEAKESRRESPQKVWNG